MAKWERRGLQNLYEPVRSRLWPPREHNLIKSAMTLSGRHTRTQRISLYASSSVAALSRPDEFYEVMLYQAKHELKARVLYS